MTTAHGTDGWTAAVKRRLCLGRLLPLGERADGAWLTEAAAVAELRGAVGTVADASMGLLRISLTDPDTPGTAVVPAPPGALAPGPLRIEGEFAARAGDPLLTVAERLCAALFDCAVERLGLEVSDVDLRVTALRDGTDDSSSSATPVGVTVASPDDELARTVAAVPGVACLTRALGEALTRSPGHVRVELATGAGHHPPAVARAVRRAVTASVPDSPSVAVLVTAVGLPYEGTFQ